MTLPSGDKPRDVNVNVTIRVGKAPGSTRVGGGTIHRHRKKFALGCVMVPFAILFALFVIGLVTGGA